MDTLLDADFGGKPLLRILRGGDVLDMVTVKRFREGAA
jgi:hypothetical protein